MKKNVCTAVIIAVIILILLICDYLDPLTVLSKKTGAFINVENWTTFLIGIFTVIGAYFGGIIVNDNIHKKIKFNN